MQMQNCTVTGIPRKRTEPRVVQVFKCSGTKCTTSQVRAGPGAAPSAGPAISTEAGGVSFLVRQDKRVARRDWVNGGHDKAGEEREELMRVCVCVGGKLVVFGKVEKSVTRPFWSSFFSFFASFLLLFFLLPPPDFKDSQERKDQKQFRLRRFISGPIIPTFDSYS